MTWSSMPLQTEVVDLLVHCQQWHMWVQWIPVLSASLLITKRYCRCLVGGANAGLLVVDTSMIGFECITAETRYETMNVGRQERWRMYHIRGYMIQVYLSLCTSRLNESGSCG